MPHSSETTWAEYSQTVSNTCSRGLDTIIAGEQAYDDMFETYMYSGGTDTTFANLLFHGDGNATLATAAEIEKATDLKNAMVAIHNLYQCLTNTAVTTSDRAADLRRMS